MSVAALLLERVIVSWETLPSDNALGLKAFAMGAVLTVVRVALLDAPGLQTGPAPLLSQTLPAGMVLMRVARHRPYWRLSAVKLTTQVAGFPALPAGMSKVNSGVAGVLRSLERTRRQRR